MPRLFSELLAVFVPPACASCRAALPRTELRLCGECTRGLPWLPERVCRRCGLPSHRRGCPASRAAFTRAWAPLAYDGVARNLVAALKFRAALLIDDVHTTGATLDACARALVAGGCEEVVAITYARTL